MKKLTLTERVAELERELAQLKANPHVQYFYPYWSVQPPNYNSWWQTTWSGDNTDISGV